MASRILNAFRRKQNSISSSLQSKCLKWKYKCVGRASPTKALTSDISSHICWPFLCLILTASRDLLTSVQLDSSLTVSLPPHTCCSFPVTLSRSPLQRDEMFFGGICFPDVSPQMYYLYPHSASEICQNNKHEQISGIVIEASLVYLCLKVICGGQMFFICQRQNLKLSACERWRTI